MSQKCDALFSCLSHCRHFLDKTILYYLPITKIKENIEIKMYIIKNALKSITRSKGRNLLIGIIVFSISVSACLGLSIRQAAHSAKETALDDVNITAQISFDRNAMMENMMSGIGSGGGFDKDSFADLMKDSGGLTVSELLKYAVSDNVKDFYYTLTVSMNGTEEFEAVDSSGTSEDSASDEDNADRPDSMFGNENMPAMPDGNKGFIMGSMGNQGDFTIIGYSTDAAMESFINGTCKIEDGTMFDEGTENLDCIISDELATYNTLEIGATITLVNPNDDEEIYELTIVGIYSNSQSTVTSGGMMGGFSTSTDPANQIYLSYNALKSITTASSENATTSTDEETGIETTTALPEQESGTYVFSNVENYNAFEKEIYELGLDESYALSSSDISSYEQSIVPLENLSEMALYFLCVVLAIGAVVLIVLNIFSVRERKYEVGVMTAIGMKKHNVSLQFMIETLIIAVIAVFLGGAVGAVTSVPVTNSLLKSQVEATSSSNKATNDAFGRNPGFSGGSVQRPGNNSGGGMFGNGGPNFGGFAEDLGFNEGTVEYISEVSSATNLTVLFQLMLIGIGLTVVASAASIVFIMRYDPLKILSNRD